jgi:hypothetical protein
VTSPQFANDVKPSMVFGGSVSKYLMISMRVLTDQAVWMLSFTGNSSVAVPEDTITITMPSPSPHHDLISVLTELHTLLDDLAVVLPSIAILPPPETGIHLPGDFDAQAAKSAGFSDEAVEVLSQMPFLDYPLELQPSAIAVPYWGMDQSAFEAARELVLGDLDEGLAPPSIIKLTDSSALMGVRYMYDAETSTLLYISLLRADAKEEGQRFSGGLLLIRDLARTYVFLDAHNGRFRHRHTTLAIAPRGVAAAY